MVGKPDTEKSGKVDISHGMDLLNRPGLNKGAAFTEEERSEHGLHGLLRSWSDTSIGALQDTNEIFFYRLLVDHIESSPVSTASV